MSQFLKQPLISAALIALGFGVAFANPGFQDQKPAPGAQKGGDKKAEGGREKGKDKAVASSVATAPMSIPLSGVTAENSSSVQAAIQGVAHPLWKCATCDHAQSEKGQCPKCKTDLTVDKSGAPAAKSVSIDAASGAVQLTLAPGQNLRMSELERALKPLSVTINARQLIVPNFARVYIEAPVGAKDGEAALERALAGTKLFTNASVHYNDHRKEFVALVESGGTATFADTSAAVQTCGKEYKIVDLAWTAPCAACAKAGSVQAGCKNCW